MCTKQTCLPGLKDFVDRRDSKQGLGAKVSRVSVVATSSAYPLCMPLLGVEPGAGPRSLQLHQHTLCGCPFLVRSLGLAQCRGLYKFTCRAF
eukprot:scaffold87815_cov15-Tisochrysis_lutea.AAC.1